MKTGTVYTIGFFPFGLYRLAAKHFPEPYFVYVSRILSSYSYSTNVEADTSIYIARYGFKVIDFTWNFLFETAAGRRR